MGNFPAPFDDGYEEAGLANWVGAAANSAKLDRGEPIFLAGLDVGAIFAVGEVYYGAGVQLRGDFGGYFYGGAELCLHAQNGLR